MKQITSMDYVWMYGSTAIGLVIFLIMLYQTIKMFFDKSATPDQFYDTILGLFGWPIAGFLFGLMLIYIALATSPIWVTIIVRNKYIKNAKS